VARRVEAGSIGGGRLMALLTPGSLPAIQHALRENQLDGWLLYDFRGNNPIALEMIGIGSILSRRIFVFVPREGAPVAISHNIEQGAWRHWPAEWSRERYSAWVTLESLIHGLVSGKRIAMEYSEGNAVPYLDRVPAGMLDLVRAAGATVVSSGELVSEFYARWTDADLASHRRAAEIVGTVARDAFAHVGEIVRGGGRIHEHDVQQRIMEAFTRAGLETYSPPNVSVGANAADPHYEGAPPDQGVRITVGNALLIDLWAREPGGVYADQTWMAVLGAPTTLATTIWDAIRDARDAAITYLRDQVAAGAPVRGADVDDAARAVITARGFGDNFTHRTGHSIDSRDIHGSGPNLDNLETRDVRLLRPGVGFSIEPGIYIRGEIGMRTEVNAFMAPGELVVTPTVYQRDLIAL
jgi:Xaa-Pro dipeptidase